MVPAGHPKALGCTPGLAPAPRPASPVRSPTPPAPSVVWPRLSSLGCPLCPLAGWLPCTGHAVPWPRPPGGLSSQALGGPACPGGHRGSQPCLAAKPQRAALTAGHVWSERRPAPCASSLAPTLAPGTLHSLVANWTSAGRPTLQQDVAAFLLYSTAPHGIRDTGSPCISAEAPQLRQGGTCFLPVMHPLCLTPLLGRGGETVTTRTVTKRPSSRARAPGLRHY